MLGDIITTTTTTIMSMSMSMTTPTAITDIPTGRGMFTRLPTSAKPSRLASLSTQMFGATRKARAVLVQVNSRRAKSGHTSQ